MDQENIMFNESYVGSYTMIDLYLNKKFFGYKDSYNYYDKDVDDILLFKKRNGKYFIRYNDVNEMNVVPLQLKIKNFYGEIVTYAYNNIMMPIHSDDKELFRKWREIWNKITEWIGINDTRDFDEYIMVDVHKNTNFVKGNYKNINKNRKKLVIVLDSVINDYLNTSLVQYRY